MSLESEVLLGVDLANFQISGKKLLHGIDDLMCDWEVKRAEFEESVRSKQAQAKQLKLRLACDICGEKAKLNCPCGTTQYCSTDCQRIDWRDRGHRKACKKIRDERAADAARAEAPSPPEEVFYGPAPRSHADEARARIAAEHEAARARREANPEPEPDSERFGSRCPICFEDWDVNSSRLFVNCCCRTICGSCGQKMRQAAITREEPCFLCRTPPPRSWAEDVARLRRHVENEQPEAMKQLGDFYRDGDFGLVKSSKKAAKLYLRAAELGEVYAMVALGALYETGGNGVKRDGKKAMKMYREATDRGLALAQSNLSNLLSVDGQYMESFRYCKLAADQGYTQAQYNAGYCYENAEGVGRNLDEAKRLYALAAAKGYEHGIAALRRLSA